jgi:hypothetical protein
MDERNNDPLDDELDLELERYLDGCLTESERVAFEARLSTDSALATKVELQHALDASLRNTFQPLVPDTGAVLERALAAGAPPSSATHADRFSPRRRFRLPAALAAGLMAAVVGWGAWSVWNEGGSDPADVPNIAQGPGPDAACVQIRGEWLALYEEQVAVAMACGAGFFRETVHGVPLVVEGPGVLIENRIGQGALPAGVEAFTARVGTTQALVFICDGEPDPQPLVGDAGNGLNLHRRTLGSLVLYELSPLDEPGVLPLVAQAP